MNIAIIPARGGSKRIPRKNIKNFCGKAMIAYSIEAAIQSTCFDIVMVSTDDAEIAEISKKLGADVPFLRPSELSDDYTGTQAVIAHAIRYLINEKKITPKNVCCIYATAPFIQAGDIKKGLDILESEQLGYVFSATRYAFPIQRAFYINPEQRIEMFYPEHFNTRSQDLEEAYHDAGQFYWGTSHAWLEQRAIFAAHSSALLLPSSRVQDIDTPEDWQRAEMMHKVMQSIGE